MSEYFTRNGVTIGSTANAIEVILEVVAGSSDAEIWHEKWNRSAKKAALDVHIRKIRVDYSFRVRKMN